MFVELTIALRALIFLTVKTLSKIIKLEVIFMTAFVTGGSRGIGAQVCKVLSENGWKVAFTYKSSEKQAREVSKVTGALAIKADVSSPDEIRKAVFRR